MTLELKVKARIPNSRLVQLTNFNSTTASAIDETVLTNAATAAKSYFKPGAGKQYDDDNDDHVALSVPLVELVLQQWTGRWTDLDQVRWTQQLESIDLYGRSIGSRKRVLPQTKSGLTVTGDKRGTARTVRPRFDDIRFDNISARPPRRGAFGDRGEDTND